MTLLKPTRFFASAALLASLTHVSWGAGEAVDFSGQELSVDAIVTALQPPMKTRGIKPGAAVGATRPAGPQAVSFDQITFEYDSSELTAEARKALDTIGQALSDERLGAVKFIVEGHTDAKGRASYNLALSKRRADSAKRYLVANFDLDSKRLDALGKGFSELRYKDNPEDGRNRRVVIRSIGAK